MRISPSPVPRVYAAAATALALAMSTERGPDVQATETRGEQVVDASASRGPLAICDERGQPIANPTQWHARRDGLREWWLDFLGPLVARKRPQPKVQLLSREDADGVVRELIEYEASPGFTTQAYVLRPSTVAGLCPGAVAFHSTVEHSIRQPAGVEGIPEKAFGLELARKGFVVICPRNFLWTNNTTMEARQAVALHRRMTPQSRGMARMLYEARVAVDVLVSQPDVDADRLGAIGHSLGAKEALYLAAFDNRIRAGAASEGGVGWDHSNWDAPWYLGPAARDAGIQHDHHELLAFIAPRSFLVVGGGAADGDHARPYVDAAAAIYRLFPGASERLELWVHQGGHAVPLDVRDRMIDWLDAALSRSD